jgi:hypothetical protein
MNYYASTLIDDTGRDLVYALIQIYRIENEKSADDIPYNGIKEKKGKCREDISWTFTDFPIKLRHILFKYVKMHTQSIEDDQIRTRELSTIDD